MKFRREDIEITWDVVQEPPTMYSCNAFPNPTNGILDIIVNDNFTHEARIQIFDIKGMKCLDSMVGKSGNQIRINLQNLEPGLYIYRLMSGKREIASGKFIKD
jgi:hypothetical protein